MQRDRALRRLRHGDACRSTTRRRSPTRTPPIPYYVEQAAQRIANAHRLLDLVPARRTPARDRLRVRLSARRRARARVRRARRRDVGLGLAVRARALRPRRARPAVSKRLDAAGGELRRRGDGGRDRASAPIRARTLQRDPPRPATGRTAAAADAGRRQHLPRASPGPRWWGLLDDHYFYFSRQTLRRLLDRRGVRGRAHQRRSGRVFPLSHWVFKLAPYSRAPARGRSRALTRALRVDELQISINLGDQMACVARKK